MLTLAIASLAIGASMKRQAAYLLPLEDLVTSMSGSALTAYCSTSSNWGANNYLSNFRVFYVNGNSTAFSPNGNWIEITSNCSLSVSGTTLTVTYSFSQTNPQGTLWIQYNGAPGDSIYGAEISIVAAEFGVHNQAGHGGRPAHIVPIVDRTPATQSNVSTNFNIAAPYAGNWDGPYPTLWFSTGPSSTPTPGGGWQPSQTFASLNPTNGNVFVSATGNANNNAGYYLVGKQETYVPGESYNVHNSQWTEFSGFIRAYTRG